jgi:hypothetical protein
MAGADCIAAGAGAASSGPATVVALKRVAKMRTSISPEWNGVWRIARISFESELVGGRPGLKPLLFC